MYTYWYTFNLYLHGQFIKYERYWLKIFYSILDNDNSFIMSDFSSAYIDYSPSLIFLVRIPTRILIFLLLHYLMNWPVISCILPPNLKTIVCLYYAFLFSKCFVNSNSFYYSLKLAVMRRKYFTSDSCIDFDKNMVVVRCGNDQPLLWHRWHA